MPATLMDGKKVAQETLDAAAERVVRIVQATGVQPCLATVLVGADPASVTYTQMKRRRCESIGMRSVKVELPASTTTQQLLVEITKLAHDPTIHGILLQHPCPSHIDERAAFEAIPVAKDVDGVTFGSFAHQWFPPPEKKHPENKNHADAERSEASGPPHGFASCTPGGIIRLLDAYNVHLAGKRAVVIGRSAILGKPMAGLLLGRHATVTICHSKTADLPAVVREADIVVAAVGRAKFVKGDWLKPGCVVMDAGYNEGNVGDVDFDAAVNVASLITPVPGGVGPMTIATLIDQTVTAAERLSSLQAG